MPSSAATKRGDAKRQAERRTRLVYAGIAFAVVAFAVIIAIFSTGEQGDVVTVEDLAGAPAVEGEPLSVAPQDPATDPDLGSAGPVVEGADFDGTPVSLGSSGEPQLLMFLASWCPACQQELPQVVSWLEDGGLPDDVGLTAVVTGLDDTRPNWPPDAWLEDEGFTGDVLVDDAEGSVARAYGLSGTPFWVALDADGQVVLRVAGLLDDTQLELLAESARSGA
jgi:cytochrome c biogenesis protein CcmG, thiol:disulfide interchange protein DsbE